MEDYNLAMFTHAMCEFKETNYKAFFKKLIERFVYIGLANT